MPTFGSLFAGIGGIDLGLERAGWTCRWQVEWDAYCQRVLAKHWPDVPRYGDITGVDWAGVERVDLLAGGFPCQPVSIAGRQHAQADDRWLWPEFARAIRELRPRAVLVENVRNLLAVNDGAAFGEVLGSLASLGYDAEWDCIPAAAIGAPHLRDRVWVVATRSEQRRILADTDDGRSRDSVRSGRHASRDGRSHVADGDGRRLESERESEHALEQGASGHFADRCRQTGRRDGPTLGDSDGGRCESGREWATVGGVPIANPAGHPRRSGATANTVGRGRDGWTSNEERRDQWIIEPDVGRVAHGVPARVDRLRALGNAVVPQVVEVIGRQLMAVIEDVA